MDNKLIDTEIQEMLEKYPLGHIESPTDLRDYTYDMVAEASDTEIPNEFELKYQFNAKDQGQIGACVNHAISSAKEIIDNSSEYYSQWWLHALRSDSDYQGKGAIIREELSHLVNDGIVSLRLFNVQEEYSQIRTTLVSKYNKEKLLKEAAKCRSTGYIKLSANEIKSYIYNEKKPIIIAVRVYENFYQAPYNNGVIQTVPIGKSYGSHAMVIVGYKNNTLKILNSWGQWGGQNGYLYLDINSSIITELWGLTDKPIPKPSAKKYKVGWDKDSNTGKWIYSEDGEVLAKDNWKQIKGIWYYFKDIYALNGEWIEYKNKWYYLEKDSCAMAADKWILWNNKWYRLGKDGAMLTGWYKDIDSKWYYLDIEKGYCYTNCTILIDGKNYSFESCGAWIESLVTDKLVNFVKCYEGFSSVPYQDEVGVWTLGYGMTGDEIKGLSSVTETQASEMLKNLLNDKYARPIKADLDSKGINLSQNQFDALCSFAYNLGVSCLFNSTLYKRICEGIRDGGLKGNFTAYKYAGGRVYQGLLNRRIEEYNMFTNADYNRDL